MSKKYFESNEGWDFPSSPFSSSVLFGIGDFDGKSLELYGTKCWIIKSTSAVDAVRYDIKVTRGHYVNV